MYIFLNNQSRIISIQGGKSINVEEQNKMDKRQQSDTDMVNTAANFFTPRMADFMQNRVAAVKIPMLTQKVFSISTHREAQISGTGTSKLKTAVTSNQFDELWDTMKNIVNFATVMAADIEGLENKFRMPRSHSRRNLIASAKVFAADAVNFKDDFINYGILADFINDLLTKADNLEQSILETSSATEARVGAVSELAIDVKAAVELVRQLNPIVRMIYRNDPANLAAWTFASHIQRPAKTKPKLPPA